MVEKRTCDYSGKEIEPGTGIMYVRTDGTVMHFADSKAEKNYFLGREARDLEWTEAGRAERAAGKTVDEQPDEDDEPVVEDEEPDEDEAADEETESVDADEEAESDDVDEEAASEDEADDSEDEADDSEDENA